MAYCILLRIPIVLEGNEKPKDIISFCNKSEYVLRHTYIVTDLEVGPEKKWVLVPKEWKGYSMDIRQLKYMKAMMMERGNVREVIRINKMIEMRKEEKIEKKKKLKLKPVEGRMIVNWGKKEL